jgi:steroid delta-isomerase
MALAPDDVRKAVAAYYAAVRTGDIEAIAQLFAPDAVMRDPVGAPPATDDAARRMRYAGISAAFASFEIVEQSVIAAGDEAAARWTASGRTRSGKDVRFDGISTFEVDDAGLITMMSAYFDLGTVAAAMQG